MKKAALVLLLLLCLLPVLPLLRPGLPPTHDGEYHIIRFYQFDKTLRDGQLYPRWQPDVNRGFGSPLPNFYYPLPNYIASAFHLLGVSFIDAFKLQMLFATILGAFSMYVLVRSFFGELGGVVAAIFYTYSPYHFLDIYIRGAVGEVWTLAIVPLFLWSMTKCIRDGNWNFSILGVLTLALTIFSHNILALLFLPFMVCFVVCLIMYQKKRRKEVIGKTLLIFLLGLGVSSIFWLPALIERQFVSGLEIFDYRRHFVEFYQLIFPSWGSGFSADPTTEGLSLQIGIANLIALFIASVLTILRRKDYTDKTWVNFFMLFWTFTGIILMLPVSKPLWESISIVRYIQFPWRILSLVIFCSSTLAGSIVFFWPKRGLSFILITLAVLLGVGYAKPPYYHQRDDSYYLNRASFIDGTNVPGDSFNTIWMNKKLPREREKVQIKEGDADIGLQSFKSTSLSFTITAKKDSEVIVNTAYFPGWTVFIDKIKVPIGPNSDGLIAFSVAQGQHVIEVRLLNTPVRTIATTISFFSAVTLLLLFVRYHHAKMKR